MTLTRGTGVFAALLIFLGPWQSAGAAQSTTGQTVGFSKAQAAEGRRDYRQHCASCHGPKLKGMHLSPSLVGDRFDRTWRGKSAGVLFFHLRRMPLDPVAEPGSLGDETYTNILAFILRSNGLAPGDEALPSGMEALGDRIIPVAKGMVYDPVVPVVKSAAQTALLNSLPPVTDVMLRNPSPNDWLHWGRTYDGQSYSPLNQINKENVKGLKTAWRVPLLFGSSMPMPLVHHGIMFLHTFPDTVLAMDATNGAVLWRYRREEVARSSKKMGLGLHGNKVLVPTSDMHVIALNAKTGEVIWDHEISTRAPDRMRRYYQLRSAPFVVGDKVIQGVTASGAPKGAFVVAMDIDSGEEVWRFNTIARPGEPEGNTWNGLALEDRSGGSVWQQVTYDPELNLIYFGVAPTYDTGPLLVPVDIEGITNEAMYTNCTVALNADTGELVWHFQHMQNDQWDLDWAFERQIVNVPVNGKMRKVVMNVGKMVMLDALDAATGEFLFSVDTGVQNVIIAVDPITGAKTIDPKAMPNPDTPGIICPTPFGARSWPQTSYSPRTNLVYVPITESCMGISTTSDTRELLSSGIKFTPAPQPDLEDGMMGRVQAIDLVSQRLAWNTDQLTPPSTGLLATGGGLLFSGDIEPSLKAFDDATGELLWEAPLDDAPSSSLVTYSVNDTQYVAVVVGMTNNHVRDITSHYRRFSSTKGVPGDQGGAAIWVFTL